MLNDELDVDVYPEQDIRILKAMTVDVAMTFDIIQQIRPDMFVEVLRPVGEFFIDYFKRYRSLPTQRVTRGELDGDLVDDVFSRFDDVEVQRGELKYDLDKMKQRYVEIQTNDLREMASNNRVDLATLEDRLKLIRETVDPKVRIFEAQDIDQYIETFNSEYLLKVQNPEYDRGILTGYGYLDYIMNGARSSELWIIGGETGFGKSVVLNNLGIQMWMQTNTIYTEPKDFVKGYNVLYFSCEMPFLPCFRRTMAKVANVPIYGLRDATLSKTDTETVAKAGQFIKRYPNKFRIVDTPRGVSVGLIEQIYQEVCLSFKPDVVIVDYLGLLTDPEAQGDDWLKLGHISAKLHEFARVYSVPVLTAVQLNRVPQGKTTSENIGVHRFGRSSMIAHNANVCLQIESRANDHLRDDISIHIIKNRDGEKGSHTFLKKFANASIYDAPYIPTDNRELRLLEGFGGQEDLSKQIAQIHAKVKEKE